MTDARQKGVQHDRYVLSVDRKLAFSDIPLEEYPMNVTHVFAANVRMYRRRLGLSQEALGERCHLHRTYISSLELEKRNISLKNVQAISEALGVEAYRLFLDPTVEYDGEASRESKGVDT